MLRETYVSISCRVLNQSRAVQICVCVLLLLCRRRSAARGYHIAVPRTTAVPSRVLVTSSFRETAISMGKRALVLTSVALLGALTACGGGRDTDPPVATPTL